MKVFDTSVFVATTPELPGTLSRGMDAAVAKECLDEAERRDEAMDRGAEPGVPAHEVLRRIERRRG
jgi:hypothetical protein